MNLPNIDAERARRDLTQKDLADLLGVSLRTVQNWQRGITEMPLSKLLRLSRIWNLSVDYLLGLTQ